MNITLIIAVTLVTLALIFYSVGFFSASKKERINIITPIFYWLGVVCDISSTIIMFSLAHETKNQSSFHGIIGIIALVLMAACAIYATIAHHKNIAEITLAFRQHRVIPYIFWVIVYVIAAASKMI